MADNKKTRDELIAICKERGIKGYSGKKKADLIKMICAVGTGGAAPTKPTKIKRIKKSKLKNPPLAPLVKWSGGKSDELIAINKHIPETFTTYLEPFVGGGAVYFNLLPDAAVINDVHKDLIAFYRAIANGSRGEIKAFMQEHPNLEETYYEVRDKMEVKTDLDRAKQFYYLRKTCYRGMLRYNSSGKMNIPFGHYKSINYSDLDNPRYETLLGRTTILNGSFEKVFEDYNSPDNFMFLDPPYDSKFTDYGYCSFGRDEHLKLAKCFKETSIRCLMVIGKTDFIADLYKDYIVQEYPKNYNFRLHSGRVGDEINTMHLVIRNY
jgi:DNA adenine methylase